MNERRSRQAGATATQPGAVATAGGGETAASTMAAKARQAEERQFWTRMAEVVSDETFEVWTQLEKHLQQYNKVLSERSAEISRVTSLQEQNVQLKALINQYLNAKVNDELIVPPSSTITLPGRDRPGAAITWAEGEEA